MKGFTFIWNFIRRILWIILSLTNWALFAVFFVLYVVFLFLLVAINPLLWLILGFDNTTKVLDFLFTHSNKELWYVDKYNPSHHSSIEERWHGDTFRSVIPLHAAYIQEKWINMILPVVELD